jgi:hypothetical protein
MGSSIEGLGILDAFERLMSVPSVTLEDAPAVARALTWFAGNGLR